MNRRCAAVVTSPTAVTAAVTAVVLGFAASLLTAVWRLASEDFSALVWVWNWPRASVRRVVVAVLRR
jgi:hypothetical protein